jgi:hypothetical protein
VLLDRLGLNPSFAPRIESLGELTLSD